MAADSLKRWYDNLLIQFKDNEITFNVLKQQYINGLPECETLIFELDYETVHVGIVMQTDTLEMIKITYLKHGKVINDVTLTKPKVITA